MGENGKLTMTEFAKLKILFEDQPAATAVRVRPDEDPTRVLAALDLPCYDGIIVVHGGASKMEEELVNAVRGFVVAGLAPLAEQRNLLIVDGGTHSGSSQLMGDARQAIGGTYPLLGVVPDRFVSYPGGPEPEEGRIPLNPAHSHFVFVAGDEFGAESRLLVGLLRASDKPGLALIINGGEIVLKEVVAHVDQGNMLVALNGSGRIADRLADPSSEERRALPPHARLWVVDINAPEQCVTLLNTLLDTSAFSA
jgi:hypothetical protein